jgi:hypothetical protein
MLFVQPSSKRNVSKMNQSFSKIFSYRRLLKLGQGVIILWKIELGLYKFFRFRITVILEPFPYPSRETKRKDGAMLPIN